MSTQTESLITIIATLQREATEIIRDPIHHDIPLSPALFRITRSSIMMKLHSIRQLGPAYLLYPGAQHTRYEHSLGVYAVARQMILSLLSRASGENSFSFSLKGIQAFFVAALLHDVGHFPYAHALKDCVSPTHEVLGAQRIEEDQELRVLITKRVGTSVASVCQIIDDTRPCEDREILFYRSVLSGTLDPDKLDYLSRDAFYCGVPYGVQDVDYLLRHIGITQDGRLYLEKKALGAVEHLLFSKYLMYKYIYWHKETRAATAMIKRSVLQALQEGLLTNRQLTHLDDLEFAILMRSLPPSPSRELFDRVQGGRLLEEKAVIPFDRSCEKHQTWASEEGRIALEEHICRELRKLYPSLRDQDITVDISEEVRFESDLPVRTGKKSELPFSKASELFSDQFVSLFTSSLRVFRVYAPAEIEIPDTEKTLRTYL